MGRMSTSQEVAKAALFLASDEGNFVTGFGLIDDDDVDQAQQFYSCSQQDLPIYLASVLSQGEVMLLSHGDYCYGRRQHAGCVRRERRPPPLSQATHRHQGGRPRVGHRVIVRVIWFVFATACRREDVPAELDFSDRTAHRRLRTWEEAGVCDRLHAELLAALKRAGKLETIEANISLPRNIITTVRAQADGVLFAHSRCNPRVPVAASSPRQGCVARGSPR